MKALTLYQPDASLVAIGAKRLETRAWQTSYRGALAIHASKFSSPERQYLIYSVEPFHTTLIEGGVISSGQHKADQKDVPYGAIIAVCELVGIVSVRDVLTQPDRYITTEHEIWFGHFQYPHYFAWQLEQVRMLPVPISIQGRQGLWTCPTSIEQQILQQIGHMVPTETTRTLHARPGSYLEK